MRSVAEARRLAEAGAPSRALRATRALTGASAAQARAWLEEILARGKRAGLPLRFR
ncbi:MAG: hypothetical protein FJ091_19680 [Deltaproteobacteria bacterium]|nr:hypothetical protein [Deltaproteobacteria bacterium]